MRWFYRAVSFVLLLLAATVSLPRPACCAPTEALPLAVTASRGDIAAWSLTDGSYTTKARLVRDDVLFIAGDQPLYGLYLIWDHPQDGDTLSLDGTELRWEGGGAVLGEQDFLHQYVELPGVEEVQLIVAGQALTLCDIYAFGEGELPRWVQVWEPPLEQADLLLLPTHADDEHLFFGGIMPYYAGELGMAVQVCYLTNHWAEPYRPHELLSGLWEAGVQNYPVFSPFVDLYSDSLAHAESLYGREAMTQYVTGLLRRFRPQVAVGHDLNGEYGHGVHMLGAHCLLEAATAAELSERFPDSAAQYGTWSLPKLYLHLYPENQLIMDWDRELSAFGKTAYEVAVDAYAHHVSQHQWFQMEHWGPYDCRKFGLAHTGVGWDEARDDLFEHIDPTRLQGYIPPEPEPAPNPPEESPAERVPPQPVSQAVLPEQSLGAPIQGDVYEPSPELMVGVLLAAVFVAALIVWILVRVLGKKK